MKENITIQDLINTLNKLPEEVKDLRISHVCGCLDKAGSENVPGIQITLEGKKGNNYVIIPYQKGKIAYDSFGKREVE